MMKILIVVLLFSCIQLSAQSPELIEPKDNTNLYNFHLYVFSGIGLAMDQEKSFWSRFFNYGVYGEIGFEFPITQSHLTSIEVNVNSWIAKHKKTDEFYDPNIQGDYNLLFNDLYTHPGFSFLFNIYFLSNRKTLRPFINFGYIS